MRGSDVYPILIFAKDAFGMVPLKGKSSMTPMVVNPKPTSGDPLAQRGTVGWKLWNGTIILQNNKHVKHVSENLRNVTPTMSLVDLYAKMSNAKTFKTAKKVYDEALETAVVPA